ncbi:MAG TPA: di-heme-cytochrome C peroxidase [Bryobacteraceae bacterium]|jgi:hypothetical protein|nr:di-heme-cytochrome C peroxidase [Bryobacteraceae bacterium]
MQFRTTVLLVLLAGASPHLPAQTHPSYCGDIDLDQSWSCSQRDDFWFRPQGARMLPYQWFLNLEQAGSTELFRSSANMDQLRFVTAPVSSSNPDGLPVGVTREPERCSGADCWAGLTCAACHTARIEFEGHSLIVDGAPGMLDFSTFLDQLVAALEATASDPAKFDRFSNAVLHSSAPGERDALRRLLLWRTNELRARADINRPVAPYGFARVDAFGHILNQVLVHDLDLAENIAPSDAPVSFPCLWDTPQHDFVQWNGSAQNTFPGNPLFRNIGEVLGVFGTVDVAPRPALLPRYRSSISSNLDNLRAIEETVRQLTSPQWPRSLYPIDEAQAAHGETTYKTECAGCHPVLKNRKDPGRTITAKLVPVTEVGTDPAMAANFARRTGFTGRLKGTPKVLLPLPAFGDTAPGVEILTNVVFGVWLDGGPSLKAKLNIRPERAQAYRRTDTQVYKARPLNGIWATAPYLHNGSVPNLWELLSANRSQSFRLGDRTFDPKHVGYVSSGSFEFDTTVPGNSNSGHLYGTSLTDQQKWELIEYLKTL